MDATIAQCRYFLALAEAALEGLTDEHRAVEPERGAKTAGWLVGHLVVTGEFARRLCGRSPVVPVEWRRAFNPGTQPSPRGEDYPRMAELRQAFRAVYEDLCAAYPVAGAGLFDAPNPSERTREALPTAGEFVAFILTGHLGYHLGQLVGWRAAAGLGRIRSPMG
jgi:DinB superfamily